MKIKINGLKKAVGKFKNLNKGGAYDPHYGYLMFDKDDGQLWTDEFYSLGHNQWTEYYSPSIINLGQMMEEREIEINMKNVRKFIEDEL